jgi:hypothetical protein
MAGQGYAMRMRQSGAWKVVTPLLIAIIAGCGQTPALTTPVASTALPPTSTAGPMPIYAEGVTVSTIAAEGGQGRLTVGPDGNIYTAAIWQYKLFVVALDGWVTLLAGDGHAASVDGPAGEASFSEPAGVAFDRAGNMYVADSGLDHPHSRCIRQISPNLMVSTFTGICSEAGHYDGPLLQARFVNPVNIATDPVGNLIVAECTGGTIRKIDLTSGMVSTLAGTGEIGHRDGLASQARFMCPVAAVADGKGVIYVADGNWQWGGCSFTLRAIIPDSTGGEVKTIAGTGERGWRDGPADQAQFDCMSDLAADAAGNVYIAETNQGVIRWYRPDLTGATKGGVLTLAGSGHMGSRDGPGKEAEFTGPLGLALDGKGYLYVADYNRAIRRIKLP